MGEQADSPPDVVFCPTCAVETLPLTSTGACAFCDTPLVAASSGPEEPLRPVLTAPLAAIVRDFVDEWRRERPSMRGTLGRASGAVEPFGPYEILAARSGLAESAIRNVRHGRSRTTDHAVADALVAALRRPEAFHDGTLTGGGQVRP